MRAVVQKVSQAHITINHKTQKEMGLGLVVLLGMAGLVIDGGLLMASHRHAQNAADAAAMDEVIVFRAGTRLEGEQEVTNGGRVLGVTALGEDARSARVQAYAAVSKINFAGMQYRHDIGARGEY